jgi:predicted anti-sigma-YlaC factor YlaD
MKKVSPKKHMIKCSDIEPHLFDFIQHELGQVQTTVIAEHLKKCEKCKDSLKELKKSLKTLEDFGINKPPEHLTEKRKKRIKFAYMHPFLNFCYIHHVIISAIVVIITLVAIIFMIKNTSLIKEKEDVKEYPVHLNLVK